MKTRRGMIVGLALLAALPAGAAPPRPVAIVSWDGAADWVVDRLLAEGKLPHLAQMAREGVRAEACRPAAPSKTACGHAALWTGAYGDVNGVTGNAVPLLPRAQHTLSEQRSGFHSAALAAEPLFVTAARAGKRVAVLSATQSYPAERWADTLQAEGVPAERFFSVSGFESALAAEQVHTDARRPFTVAIGEQTFTIAALDDPSDPTVGLDTLEIRLGERRALLKPREAGTQTSGWSGPWRVTKGELFGNAYFRLFALAPDGRMTLYQRAVNGLRGAASRTQIERYLDAYGGFHDAPFDRYEQGELGAPLWAGGDGTAERRLLECIRLDVSFLIRSVRYALRTLRPDLLFHYSPAIDSAGHEWMGILDPDSPRHDPGLARKLWPFYAEVYVLHDAWLGALREALGPRGALCLVSDHGMEGIGKYFWPNVVLEQAGLTARDAQGGLDLARTRVCAPPWGDYLLCVNGTDWKEGVVAPAEREAALQAATRALLSFVDPETGQSVVTAVFRPERLLDLGMGGPAGGDLYLELAPGYAPRSRFAAAPLTAEALPIGAGVHGFFPLRRRMQAIFFLAGPGVAQGREIPLMRQIDVAPTLARLMGIPAPRDARGHVLGDALRERTPT